jgi:hypothetical protein
MRKMFGGKWISFLALPPITILFLLLVVAATIRQRIIVARRRRKVQGKADETWIGSWF